MIEKILVFVIIVDSQKHIMNLPHVKVRANNVMELEGIRSTLSKHYGKIGFVMAVGEFDNNFEETAFVTVDNINQFLGEY